MRRTSRIILALALSFSLVGLAACSSGGSNEATDDTAIEKEEEVVLGDEDVEEIDLEELEEELVAEEEEAPEEEAQETKRVGAEGIGFVEVPSSWVEFKDVDGNDAIQWCDGTPYTIISLDIFDMESVPEEMRVGFSPEDAANSVWANILNQGVEEENVQGARVKIADHDAFQVYCMYPDESFLVCWLFLDDDGVIRYVSAEGTGETILDAVEMIEDTYAL